MRTAEKGKWKNYGLREVYFFNRFYVNEIKKYKFLTWVGIYCNFFIKANNMWNKHVYNYLWLTELFAFHNNWSISTNCYLYISMAINHFLLWSVLKVFYLLKLWTASFRCWIKIDCWPRFVWCWYYFFFVCVDVTLCTCHSIISSMINETISLIIHALCEIVYPKIFIHIYSTLKSTDHCDSAPFLIFLLKNPCKCRVEFWSATN